MKKSLMIVTRTLSPPTENSTEIVYSGEPFPFVQIKDRLNLNGEEMGKYYWDEVLFISRKKRGVQISQQVYTCSNLDDYTWKRGSHSEVFLDIDDKSKKSILKFLEEV